MVAPQHGSFNSIKQTTTTTAAHTAAPPPSSQAATLHQLAQHISNAVGAADEDTDMGDSGSTSGALTHQHVASNGSPSSNFNPRYLPVDFTSSFRSQSTTTPGNSGGAPMTSSLAYHSEDATLAPLQLNQAQTGASGSHNHNSPRKRSLSVSSGADNGDDSSITTQRLHSISSILNPRSAGSSNMDIPIEPSLLGLGPSAVPDKEQQRVYLLREKRLRLEREQRRLREEMEALDRELATVEVPAEPLGVGDGLTDTARDLLIRTVQRTVASVDRVMTEGSGVRDGGGRGEINGSGSKSGGGNGSGSGNGAGGGGSDAMILT